MASAGGWTVRTRVSLAALALTVFALVFSEFLPTGLLTPMAKDLAISPGMAGQTVTATALAGMISALLIGLAIGSKDRKIVMLALSGLALAGNILSIVATEIGVLIAARAAVGVAIGGFWALSAGVVGRLVPAKDIGRAMGVIIIGVSIATIAAPPAGAFISAHWGWRTAMAVASGASLLALVVQALVLPPLPAGSPVKLRTLVAVSQRRTILIGLLAVVMIAGGHFAGFTYIRPVLQDIGGLNTSNLAAALLFFGFSNFAGNLLGSALVDRHLRYTLGAAAALIGVSALGIQFGAPSSYAVIALICIWGGAFGAAPVALQTWMAKAASDQLESVGSLFIATFQIAIAVGAFAGGALVDAWGVSAALIFVGLLTLSAAMAPVLADPSHIMQEGE